ncbi:MAG: cold shock domain-containing protein [Bacteroidetes bacterium]|nr:cold shock domain-containing protein [Bacteroidota bacterium]
MTNGEHYRFGFIRAEDGREIFFHMSSLQGIDIKDLKEGDIIDEANFARLCGSDR